MRTLNVLAPFVGGAIALSMASISAQAQSNTTTATTSNRNCKIIERGSDEAKAMEKSGTLSTTVTAGGGSVSAHTNAPNSVTVQSGSGSASSSVTTGSSSGGQTVVSANGECFIFVDPKK
jgi:hypothetical protein